MSIDVLEHTSYPLEGFISVSAMYTQARAHYKLMVDSSRVRADCDSPLLMAMIAELRRKMPALEASNIPFTDVIVTLIRHGNQVSSKIEIAGGGFTPVSEIGSKIRPTE